MSLKTKALISSVTNLSDARFATGMGVDFIGFNIDENARDAISLTDFTAITAWLEGPTMVGETSKIISKEKALELAQSFELGYMISDSEEQIEVFKSSGMTTFLRTEIISIGELENITTVADHIIVETAQDFTIEDFNHLDLQKPVFTANSFNSGNINDWIEQTNITGIELRGSEEIRTGFVDLDEMADILEAIEIY